MYVASTVSRVHSHVPKNIVVMSLSSQVQQLKAKLEEKNRANSASLPQHSVLHGHHTKARSQKERERIQIETAKKMASRFNLTYRALALSTAKQAAENRAKDMQAAREAKENAAKYQMTARALQMSSTGTATGRVNVLNHDNDDAPAEVEEVEEEKPPVLQDLSTLAVQEENVEVAAPPATPPPRVLSTASEGLEDEAQDQVSEMPVSPRRKKNTTAATATDDFDDAASMVNVPVPRDEDLLSTITEREEDEDEHDAFWLPDLSTALERGDDTAINLAIIQSFFVQFDPSRVAEAPELLQAHAGREEQLMESLNMEYPQQNMVYNEVEAGVEAERVRPKSMGRLTGLTLDITPAAAPQAQLSTAGEAGYILNAVKKQGTTSWEINSNAESEHAALLRKRMAAKGYKTDVIEAVIGSESEML